MMTLDSLKVCVVFEPSLPPFCLYVCFQRTKYEKKKNKKKGENCTISPIFPKKTADGEIWWAWFWSRGCLQFLRMSAYTTGSFLWKEFLLPEWSSCAYITGPWNTANQDRVSPRYEQPRSALLGLLLRRLNNGNNTKINVVTFGGCFVVQSPSFVSVGGSRLTFIASLLALQLQLMSIITNKRGVMVRLCHRFPSSAHIWIFATFQIATVFVLCGSKCDFDLACINRIKVFYSCW